MDCEAMTLRKGKKFEPFIALVIGGIANPLKSFVPVVAAVLCLLILNT
jgi:hypothetical protein